jgi:hypothetical protein
MRDEDREARLAILEAMRAARNGEGGGDGDRRRGQQQQQSNRRRRNNNNDAETRRHLIHNGRPTGGSKYPFLVSVWAFAPNDVRRTEIHHPSCCAPCPWRP